MLIVDHKDHKEHDKTNIQDFLKTSMARYSFFTLKTLILDYMEDVLEIHRSNTTSFEFESYYKKYLYKISNGLKRLKQDNLIVKYNTRAWKVVKPKPNPNDFDVMKFVDELRKNGYKIKLKYPSE